MSFEQICAELERAVLNVPEIYHKREKAHEEYERFKANSQGKDEVTQRAEAEELKRSWVRLAFLGPNGNFPGTTEVEWYE